MKLKLSTLFLASIALFSGITSGEVQAYFHSNEDGVEDLINTALTSEFGSLVDLKDDILSDDPARIELIGNSQESRGFDRNGNPLLSTTPLRELSKTLPNLRDFVAYKRNSILNSGTGKLIENSNEIDDQMLSDLEKKDLQVREELLGRLNTMSDTTLSSMSNQYRDGERMERIFSDSSNEVGSKAKETLNKAKKARKIYQTKQKVNNWRDNNRYSKRRQMKSLNEWKTAMNERDQNSNEEDNDISTTSTDNGSTVEKQGLFSDISGKLQPPTFSMSMSSKVSEKLTNSAAVTKENKYIEKKEQIEAKAAKQAEKKQAKIEKYIQKGKEVPEEWLEDDLFQTTTSDIFWNKYTEAGNSNARYFDGSGEFFNPSSPDFQPPEIPDHFEKTLTIKQLDGAQYRCAWQAPITASNANYAYPDLNCNYLVYYARGITPNRPIRIKANFPPTEKVAYFSYQSSDIQSSFTIKSIKDYELIPSSGVNPYKTGSSSSSLDSNTNTTSSASSTGLYGETIGDATSVDENRYEIWLSVTGQMGFENEMGMLNNPETTDEDVCNGGCSAVIILRYYTVKPGTNALSDDAYDDNRLFGFTTPPEVSQLDGTKDFKYKMPVQNGNKTKNVNIKHTLNSFSVLQTCDYEKPTVIGNAIGNYILQLLPEMEVAEFVNKRNNFVAFTGGAALFPNEDANYLWTTSYKPNLISANDPDYYNYEIIGKMRGKLPTVPHNEHPPFDKPRKYDMRYQSISSVAAIAGAPTINTLTAKDIELFYTGEVAEDLRATTHEWYNEQNYSIVFASSKGVASKCLGSEYVNDKDMFLTTTFDDIAQEHWGTVFRQVISKYQRTGLEDQSVAYAIEKCREKTETDDFNYCTSPEYLEEIMGPFYPKIDYFKCNIITGEMELLTDDMSQYNKQ